MVSLYEVRLYGGAPEEVVPQAQACSGRRQCLPGNEYLLYPYPRAQTNRLRRRVWYRAVQSFVSDFKLIVDDLTGEESRSPRG